MPARLPVVAGPPIAALIAASHEKWPRPSSLDSSKPTSQPTGSAGPLTRRPSPGPKFLAGSWLLTNVPDLAPAEAVARYKSLADIERGFRVLKSDIEIAPVHHRLSDRIRAHAMICFLALVLYRVMRMRLKAKGHSANPRTALDLLARIHRHQARINDRKLESITTPSSEQLDLFDALNLPKPA